MSFSWLCSSWSRPLRWILIVISILLMITGASLAQTSNPKFRVVALAEAGGIHRPFVDAAKVWLQKLAADRNFTVDYIENTDKIDDDFLSHYQLFIQLNYPPYGWTPKAVAPSRNTSNKDEADGSVSIMQRCSANLTEPKCGRGSPNSWEEFASPTTFRSSQLRPSSLRTHLHPAMKGVTGTFIVDQEEWYTWDKSPRPNVHVLARVDESTYSPDTRIKMGGDHPVIWTNEHCKARNIYIFMGHHPELFQNPSFTTIFRNSIFWAASQ